MTAQDVRDPVSASDQHVFKSIPCVTGEEVGDILASGDDSGVPHIVPGCGEL